MEGREYQSESPGISVEICIFIFGELFVRTASLISTSCAYLHYFVSIKEQKSVIVSLFKIIQKQPSRHSTTKKIRSKTIRFLGK
jgi:hypothetical protein